MSAVREGLIISGPNVVLSSLKQSEDRQALVIRLYNPSDDTTRAIVDFPIDISAAHMVNLQEQLISELPVENNKKIVCTIPSKKVVTMKVQSASFKPEI
jgi:alpha-mannosidase